MNDETRIANYLAGEGTPQERADTERWIAADPQRRSMLDALRTAWLTAGRAEPSLDVDRAWEQLQRRQAARSVPQPPLETRQPHAGRPRVLALMPRSSSPRTGWLRAAAVVVAVTGAGALIARLAQDFAQQQAPAPAMRDVATARGQRATVTLSDGSRVVLGFQSRLRFAEGFGGARRDVYLAGEALFEVQHDSLRPFVVHTARATATDLGTTFVVRDYAADSIVTVAVRDGIVSLRQTAADSQASNKDTSVTLAAGEYGRLKATGQLSSHRGPVDDFFAWSEGRLAFRNAPLSDVAATLERWYDVEIYLAGDVRRRTINATFGDEGIETTLDLIAKATDVAVMRRGRTFTLSPVRR